MVNLIKMGKLIRIVRKLKGLTQEQLAERVNVGVTTISNYEKGIRLPETEIMILLCRELDLLPTELLTGMRIQNEEVRKEMLDMLKEDDMIKHKHNNGDYKIKYTNHKGEEQEIDLRDFDVVTVDRKGRLTDVLIPFEDEKLYTQEEIYALQDAKAKGRNSR